MVLRETERVEPSLASRAILGAIAGFAGTVLMTAAMQRLYEKLPHEDRYPLTPREITETVAEASHDDGTATRALTAHFAYGALTGALFGLVSPRGHVALGSLYGIGVWCASYLGWIPAAGILKPATAHPPRRNALMLAAHVVWGVSTALSLTELNRAHRGAFGEGELKDVQLKAHPGRGGRARDRRELHHPR